MSVRTAELQHAISISDVRASRPLGADIRTVEVKLAVSIYDAPASGPQLSDVWTVNLKCNSCLMETHVQTGYHIV
jgi:hypothetical protein